MPLSDAERARRYRMRKAGSDVADLIALLALCRDCIDTGRPDLARTVLHVIVEHQANLGERSRDLARHLAEQMAEEEREQQQ
jgi:hypothetical protein